MTDASTQKHSIRFTEIAPKLKVDQIGVNSVNTPIGEKYLDKFVEITNQQLHAVTAIRFILSTLWSLTISMVTKLKGVREGNSHFAEQWRIYLSGLK